MTDDDGTTAGAWARLARGATTDLSAWTPSGPDQMHLRGEYLDLLDRRGADAVRRDGGAEHLTVSGFVLSEDLTRVLLCLHRKGGFWVQTGGHLEAGDTSPAVAALREAREESGIDDLALAVPGPVDLDRHALGAAFGRCRAHWDVGYALLADASAATAVSDESDDVAWFDVDALPEGAVADLPRRLARVRAALGALPTLGR